MSIFARTITDDQVEDAVVLTLKKWFSTELRVIEEDLGLTPGFYSRPRAWEIHGDFDKFPEEQLPAVVVISAGTTDTPIKDGGKKYRAHFDIAIAVFASSLDMNRSRRFAYRMGGAARACMLHRQSLDGALDGTVRGVTWTSSRNGEMPVEDDRTIWATRQVFSVEVGDTITQSAGPPAPDADPPPDGTPLPEWDTIPDLQHIHVDKTKLPTQ